MASNTGFAFQAACIAIASRLVASSFRIVEAFNPKLQKRNVISNPPVVIKREVVTVGLAWLFSLITNLAINPFADRRKWNKQTVMFFTAMFGSFFAESLGRVVAYRKAMQAEKAAPPSPPVTLSHPKPEPQQPIVALDPQPTPDTAYPSAYYQPATWSASGYGGYPASYSNYGSYAYGPYNTGYPGWSGY